MAEPNGDTPVLDLMARMTADSMETSTLDAQTLMLVRVAALVAVNAPPVSYLANLGVAADADIDGDQLRGVLAGIAPIVGTARIAAAAGGMMKAFGAAVDLAELAAADDD